MRPRVRPAEDFRVPAPPPAAHRASMRPRVRPAEDRHLAQLSGTPPFASMRPRVRPAEDGRNLSGMLGVRRCFNEAAGQTRGRLATGTGASFRDFTLQ